MWIKNQALETEPLGLTLHEKNVVLDRKEEASSP